MRISVKINGNEVLNQDVMFMLGLRAVMHGLPVRIPEGAHVTIEASNKKMVICEHFTVPIENDCDCDW